MHNFHACALDWIRSGYACNAINETHYHFAQNIIFRLTVKKAAAIAEYFTCAEHAQHTYKCSSRVHKFLISIQQRLQQHLGWFLGSL